MEGQIEVAQTTKGKYSLVTHLSFQRMFDYSIQIQVHVLLSSTL